MRGASGDFVGWGWDNGVEVVDRGGVCLAVEDRSGGGGVRSVSGADSGQYSPLKNV